MNRTKIEWVKNPDGNQGYTWNPITGCLNHINGMCKGGNFPCYAYRLANGRLRSKYLVNRNIAIPNGVKMEIMRGHGGELVPYQDPFYPRWWPDRLEQVNGQKPKGVFVCDMSDLFGIGIPERWTKCVLSYMKSNPHHRFYLLTKQPQNLHKFSPFPDNCWVGVTATNNNYYAEAVNALWEIEAKIKFISFEPLLGLAKPTPLILSKLNAGINWLIIGAQTKPYKPPRIEWVKEIVEAADRAGIPVFLKDNLSSAIPFSQEYSHFYRYCSLLVGKEG